MVVWGYISTPTTLFWNMYAGFFFEIIKMNKRIDNKPLRCREQNVPAHINRVETLRSRVSDRCDFSFSLWITCSQKFPGNQAEHN